MSLDGRWVSASCTTSTSHLPRMRSMLISHAACAEGCHKHVTYTHFPAFCRCNILIQVLVSVRVARWQIHTLCNASCPARRNILPTQPHPRLVHLLGVVRRRSAFPNSVSGFPSDIAPIPSPTGVRTADARASKSIAHLSPATNPCHALSQVVLIPPWAGPTPYSAHDGCSRSCSKCRQGRSMRLA